MLTYLRCYLQLREVRAQVDIREEKIRDLKMEVETERESKAKHMAIASSLHKQLVQFQAETGSLEGAANRSELAVHSLQSQNNELQNRILELETRLRLVNIKVGKLTKTIVQLEEICDTYH